ncbi:MAG: hypothetical protein KAR19_20535 [Bacteroidales bacterium]|nr:hypothetical protein [Bacteroidales bacterium]
MSIRFSSVQFFFQLVDTSYPLGHFYNRKAEKPCGPGSMIKRGDGGQAIVLEAIQEYYMEGKMSKMSSSASADIILNYRTRITCEDGSNQSW